MKNRKKIACVVAVGLAASMAANNTANAAKATKKAAKKPVKTSKPVVTTATTAVPTAAPTTAVAAAPVAKGGKLTFGPVWDFDLALGNVNYNGADLVDGWYSRQAQWYTRLFQDPGFKARYKERWAEMKRAGTIDSLQNLVFSRANYLSVVQKRNFERWPILGTYVWPNRVVTGSFDGETIALKGWLLDRVRWMDAEIAR